MLDGRFLEHIRVVDDVVSEVLEVRPSDRSLDDPRCAGYHYRVPILTQLALLDRGLDDLIYPLLMQISALIQHNHVAAVFREHFGWPIVAYSLFGCIAGSAIP